MARLFERHLAKAVEAALSDTRVVAVTGARQAGKSTLVHAQMTGRAGEERTRDGVAVDGALESAAGRVVAWR